MPRFNQETGAHLTNTANHPFFRPLHSSPNSISALLLFLRTFTNRGKAGREKIENLPDFEAKFKYPCFETRPRIVETTGSRTLESTPARGFKKITYVKGFLASHICPRGCVFRPAITSAHYDIRNFYLDDGGRTTLEPRNTRPRVTK